MEATAQVDSRASLQIRSIVLPRAQWKLETTADGRPSWSPVPGTWHAHVIRGLEAHQVTVVPLLTCPVCMRLMFLSPSPEAAAFLSRYIGVRVPVAHRIDHLGKVSPDLQCRHDRCTFHRHVVLDRWNKNKTLYAVAYIDLTRGEHGEIEIDYCHAVDRREAMFHFGQRKNVRIIDAGPAVGFFVNEKTGKVTAQ